MKSFTERRRVAVAMGGPVFLVVFLTGVLLHAQDPGSAERQAYDKKIRETYDFSFGPELSVPGNAATQDGAFIPPAAFPKPSYCEHCHSEAYSQWRQSLHSNAFRTPFY